jgi:hypothetical protein
VAKNQYSLCDIYGIAQATSDTNPDLLGTLLGCDARLLLWRDAHHASNLTDPAADEVPIFV